MLGVQHYQQEDQRDGDVGQQRYGFDDLIRGVSQRREQFTHSV